MTVDLDIIEKPSLIAPKKRVNGKKSEKTATHVDHIIVIQGASTNTSSKKQPFTEGVLEHHKINGNGFGRSNGIKSHTVMDLPMIPDDDEKYDPSPTHIEKDSINDRPQSLHKSGYQQLHLNLHSSREMVDLSPIYENSSDACSSHDDVQGSVNEIIMQKNSKTSAEDTNDSNTATPYNLSQTHSETSLEMGSVSEGPYKHGKKTKKKVNIASESNTQPEDSIDTETSALKCDSETSGSPERSVMSSSTDGYLTMTGTIKRGKKKGQNIDVKLNISREELEILEAAIVAKEISKAQQWFMCSPTAGLHVMIWTFICMPFAMVISGVYSFYIGTITWYNIFTFVSEGKSLWKRIFISPFVILLYPFLIMLFTVGVGLYAGIAQLTCCGSSWWKEICDLEKGFYGWFCGMLHLSDCSPYEVVILTDLKVVENTDMRGHSSTEDIST